MLKDVTFLFINHVTASLVELRKALLHRQQRSHAHNARIFEGKVPQSAPSRLPGLLGQNGSSQLTEEALTSIDDERFALQWCALCRQLEKDTRGEQEMRWKAAPYASWLEGRLLNAPERHYPRVAQGVIDAQ